jgi:HSP20 family protein
MHRDKQNVQCVHIFLKECTKDLVREYQTPNGANVREVGSIAYGYSITIGPGGKPHVKVFEKVNAGKEMHLGMAKPSILVERELLSDITATEKGVNAVMQIPGIGKKILK